jgi:hypothetical protein
VLLETVDERDGELLVHVFVLGYQNEPEVRVDAALDAMSSKSQVDVSRAAQRHIVLNI